eukprot:CAMPEP_0183328092 /NCGR_PEP_ID=MMETSP0160_2-20130417/84107_1 /TAXON_ID=2839 ORGANISM="Odontella Sinensis, Strain Grunow 1884" /NCGR_SAMPLE_ID=MMETSP0160_2 /ASSEMBLY_ACC=CAM_ASM_000250 /LENGTH=255 /DNA_ID=CAMNT_0025496249 /DNA_START=41 /DNA_END=809 /DNA_ORIENTATION=-
MMLNPPLTYSRDLPSANRVSQDCGACHHKLELRRPASRVAPAPLHQPKAIPLPSTHVHRTKSELQLDEDQHAAEWRDRCMFQRLVVGIRERQQKQARRLALARQSVAPLPPPATMTADKTHPPATVSPYESPLGSPFPGAPPSQRQGIALPGAPPSQRQQDPRQHLQAVLHRASGRADEALGGMGNADWSISVCAGDMSQQYWSPQQQYHKPQESRTSHQVPHSMQAYHQHPVAPISSPCEDCNEMDGEVFSLEL